MARKILPAALILSILTSCVLGILLLSQRPEDQITGGADAPSRSTQLKATVESGVITSEFYTEGRVVSNSPEYYIETIAVEFTRQSDRDGFKMYKEKTAEINQGERLYSFRGKDYNALCNCRLVDVQISKDMAIIDLLNYEKLFIETAVGLEKLEHLDLHSEVSIRSHTSTVAAYEGSIINIGYEVDNGLIPVMIRTSERMLPGTEVKITFTTTRDIVSLYILKQMLKQDSDGYYLEILKENGERERANVEIGEFFLSYQGDTPTEFVEILSGVSEGSTIITDILQVDTTAEVKD